MGDYDVNQDVSYEGSLVGRKKLARKAEKPTRRGIAWPRWTGFRGMTVRDWLDLLIVPLALVVVSFLFTMQQDKRQQEIEDQRARQAQQIEEQRANAERKLADQRAQDEVLQIYLDQMGTLMLKENLRESEKDSEVRTLARARTLTVLKGLDPGRKTAVMDFLQEADLITKEDGTSPIISLAGADLKGADLVEADLVAADLKDANLSDANLSDADLSGANLSAVELFTADLKGADLSDADLSDADLTYADLENTNLNAADLRGANLSHAQGLTMMYLERHVSLLEGATMPNGWEHH